MGIRIPRQRAQEVFDRALELARADVVLPDEWLRRTRRVATATSATYTPALGTALLAKASNDHISTLAVKAKGGHNAYSMRSVGHGVLVPRCTEEGISLRTTGREPLNNQPFFNPAILRLDLVVKDPEDFAYLYECLQQADFLRGDEAMRALAAFLRARIEDPASVGPAPVRSISRTPLSLAQAAVAHAIHRPEGGRRGQALIAAAMDLIYDEVATGRINDPSAAEPGDIRAGPPTSRLVREVKQRSVTDAEAQQLIDRMAARGVDRFVLDLVTTAPGPAAPEELRSHAGNMGLLFDLRSDPATVIADAMLYAKMSVADAVIRFANAYSIRLREQECTSEGIADWLAIATKD